ncbi:MAG: histidine kinase, partial [Acidobacteriota bacterium]
MALEDNRLIPEKPSEPHYGRYVVALVVFIGLGVTLANTRPSAGLLALVGLLGGVYTLLSIVFGEDRWAEPTRPQLWAYFSVQLALAGVLAAILAGEGIYSMQWLMLMPLIAQGRIFLQPWGAALIVLASLSIIAAHIHALAGWRAVPGAVLGVFTAVIFVLLFTDIARREAIAREKSQSLSQQLLAANTQLADFAVKAEELAAERERSRLAREIHDSVGHYLTVVHVQLEAAKTMLERDPAKCRDALDKAQGLTQQGLDEIRHSVASLRATPLEGRSLQESLGELVARSQQTGLSTHLEVLG